MAIRKCAVHKTLAGEEGDHIPKVAMHDPFRWGPYARDREEMDTNQGLATDKVSQMRITNL